MDAAQTAQELERLTGSLNAGSGATNDLIQVLQKAAQSTRNLSTAESAAADALRKAESAAETVAEGHRGLYKQGVDTAKGMIGLTGSVYGADKAFTSVIPVLDEMTNTATGFISALGKSFSGIEIAGFSFGRASEGLAEFANLGIIAATKSLSAQLTAAQKIVDNYHNLSKSGALFGGSIRQMTEDAAGAHLPINEFSKVIQTNVENISKLGLGMTFGGKMVASMSKEIYDTNDELVALYGNFNDLATGTADFLALQSQLGIDVVKDYKNQKVYAQEYLIRQKELSAITGKTAETLKREEEGRRKQLDYNLKLGRLGDVAQANVREGMAMAGQIFGDQGAKYAEEYFATGGKIYSREAREFQAVNQEAADAIGQFMSSVDTDRKTYRDKNSQYLKDNSAALEANARSQEDMAEINRAANHPLIKQQVETNSAILANLNLIKNSTDVFGELEAGRKKRETMLQEGAKEFDPYTKAFVEAEKQRMGLQQELDKLFLHGMENMDKVTATLNNITLGMAKTQLAAGESLDAVFASIASGTKKVTEAFSDFQKYMSGEFMSQMDRTMRELDYMRNNPPRYDNRGSPIRPSDAELNQWSRQRAGRQGLPPDPVNPQTPAPAAPTSNLLPTATDSASYPGLANGGITTGPSIVGEAGTEAVIPLKNGSVPLKIDLTQLVQAMAEQTKLTKDVIRELQDSNDLTKKLIDYST